MLGLILTIWIIASVFLSLIVGRILGGVSDHYEVAR
jgi:hypothetical protein